MWLHLSSFRLVVYHCSCFTVVLSALHHMNKTFWGLTAQKKKKKVSQVASLLVTVSKLVTASFSKFSPLGCWSSDKTNTKKTELKDIVEVNYGKALNGCPRDLGLIHVMFTFSVCFGLFPCLLHFLFSSLISFYSWDSLLLICSSLEQRQRQQSKSLLVVHTLLHVK